MEPRKVVLFKSEEGWIARWLQHDFVGQGTSAELAFRNLHLAIELHANLVGENPFADIPPSADFYWRMYERASVWESQELPRADSKIPPPWMIHAMMEQQAHL